MNYIAQLRGFKRLRMVKPISAEAIALYHVLMEYGNEICFPAEFTVANCTIQGLAALSPSGLQRARGQLVDNGYIVYKTGTGNQCGTYSIIDLTVKFDSQIAIQNEGDFEQQTDSKPIDSQIAIQNEGDFEQQTDSKPIDSQIAIQNEGDFEQQTERILTTLNKLNETKQDSNIYIPPNPQKGEREKIPYQEIADEFNRRCTNLPKMQTLSDRRKRAIQTVFKTYTLEQIYTAFDKAQGSSFLNGSSGRWSGANFDWIMNCGNMAKVLDGNYDDRQKKILKPTGTYGTPVDKNYDEEW